MIEIVDPGLLTTVQDRGRPGYAHIGISHSGAVDPVLAAHCNRLVGNPLEAAVLETVGGLTLRAVTPTTVATDIEPVAHTLRVGETLHLDIGGGRQWHYVSVRGGVEVEPVLGSRSTDTLGGIGPGLVRAGDRLRAGPEPLERPVGDVAPVRTQAASARLIAGPRVDWFTPDTLDRLLTSTWRIGAASRVGVRLNGPSLTRDRHDELPSEGLVRGAIQVPHDGDPIMMSADHPTTGGYPVVAVVHPDDVAIVAQTPSGQTVRFRL